MTRQTNALHHGGADRDEAPWQPVRHSDSVFVNAEIPKPVAVRIDYREDALRQQVKAAGGRWDADKRVCKLPLGQVRALGLGDRIVR